MTLEERYYGMAQYLITVDISGNINSENVESRTLAIAESTLHMQDSSIAAMLSYTRAGISFSRSTTHAISFVNIGIYGCHLRTSSTSVLPADNVNLGSNYSVGPVMSSK